MKTVLCCLLLFVAVVAGLAAASERDIQDVRYVAPTMRGTGSGQTEDDAALYTAPDFWQGVQSALAQGPVTIRFPSDLQVTLAGEPPVVHFRLVKRGPKPATR